VVFAFCALLYALSSMGRFNSTDGRDMYNTAQSLLLRHSLAIPPFVGTFVGRGGLSFAKYGIGQSIAELPLALMDQAAHALGLFTSAPQLFASLTNAWITAAGVVVLYQIIRDLGYARRPALATALAYAVTTPAWPYAKLDFSEPLLALSLLLAALGTYRFGTTGRARWALLAGAALGAAVLTKYAAAALVPLFAVYMILAARRRFALTRFRALRAAAAFSLPIAAGVALTLAVNWLRSGSPWMTGYADFERPFNQSVPLTLHAGAALLASPRYGLVFFATPVLLGAAGFRAFRRSHPLEAWGVAVLAGGTLLLYASYPTWYAGWTWGPRFLVPIVPFLLLPAVEVFSAQGLWRQAAWWVRAALAAGLVEQLLGVLVNYRATYDLLPWAHPPTARIWEPWTSPLLEHLAFLPVSLLTNLGLRVPLTGVTWGAVNYALGRLAEFFSFFWFQRFPQPILALAVGALVAAPLLAACGRGLVRRMAALAPPDTDATDVMAAMLPAVPPV
jgi:4-amino-4-deoxy-L-arabinose transferase-like glycosyltransferase